MNNSRKKRNRIELIASILTGARNGASKTKLMYSAFMSFDQLQKYIAFAIETKLISSDNSKYSITEKGIRFLRHFEDLQKTESVVIEKRRVLDDLLQNSSS